MDTVINPDMSPEEDTSPTVKFAPIPNLDEGKTSLTAKVPSVFDQFSEVDEVAEEEGAWTTSIGQGMEIKIRAFTSRVVMEAYNRYMNIAQKQVDKSGDVPADVAKDMASRVVAEAMVVDWKGPAFVDEDGKTLEYSKEAVYFFAKKSKAFRMAVYNFSMADDSFQKEVEADAVKNS